MPIGVVGAITPWNFPIAIPSWKLMPGARLRQHRRAQAGRATRRSLAERFVELLAEAGIPAGRRQHRPRLRRGRPATRLVRHPDVRVITLHRLARDGRRRHEGRRRHAQARPSRARRQERDHRHGRRRPRPRRRGDRLVGVRHERPALHGRLARDRRTRRSTASSQSRLVAAAEQMRLGPGWEDATDVGPLINAHGAREGRTPTPSIGTGRGREAPHRRRAGIDGDLGKGFYYRPTVFARRRPGRCGSRRRRSSARRRR